MKWNFQNYKRATKSQNADVTHTMLKKYVYIYIYDKIYFIYNKHLICNMYLCTGTNVLALYGSFLILYWNDGVFSV